MSVAQADSPSGGAIAATLAGFRHGVALTLPLLPGCFFFGAAFGALAAQKGLSLMEATLFSGLTFAGASQFAAMEAWSDHRTLIGVLTLSVIVGIVNLRFVLMGASLRPWLAPLPQGFVYSQFFVLTDINYVVASRYRSESGADAGVIFGSGVALWIIWTLSAVPGYLLGALVSDPRTYAIDLIMPIMFGMMTVSLWRSHRDTRNWLIAGAVALVMSKLIPGQWHIIGGAIAGMLSAAFLDRDEAK
ncbi:AzlC family ABC transporter permease [Terrarubrum flagellatum]|uniref:AzlC family ABC transporter permease n=1 Tax=Terrirubrum flagellatum TaxID=2895980 RepID=UPI0031455755